MTDIEFQKQIDRLLNTIQQQRGYGNDGSDLTPEAISNVMQDIEAKAQEGRDKLASEINDLTRQISEAKKNGNKGEEQRLKNERVKKEKEQRSYESNVAQTKLKYRAQKRKESKDNVYRTLTNGSSDSVRQSGKSLSKFGNSISNITGGKGALGKFGGTLTKVGGALSKFAGPIGVAITVIQAGVAAFKTYNKIQQRSAELEQEKIGIDNQRLKAQNAITLKKMQLDNEVLSQTTAYNNEMLSMRYDMASQISEFHANLSNQATQMNADGYVAANKMAIQAPFDIKGAMYAAGNAAIDLASQARMYDIEKSFGGDLLENNLAIAKANMDKTTGLYQTELQTSIGKAQNEINTDTKQMILDYNNSMIDYRQHEAQAMKDNVQDVAGAIGQFVPGVETASSAIGDIAQSSLDLKNAQNQVKKVQNETAFIQDKQMNDIANMELDNQNIRKKGEIEYNNIRITGEMKRQNVLLNMEKKNAEINAKAASDILKEYMGLAQKVNDEFLKMENNAYIMGREMGFSGQQLKDYTYSMGKSQIEVSVFGKNLAWMQQQQSTYQDKTGRNVQFSDNDMLTSAGLGMLVGDETVNELVSGMEIFNTSVADSNTMVYEMYRNASKMGLNGKKLTKDIANNLKLAEKYNFKNGVRSLMEMSKWAQNMRFNMNSLDGMLDKVQTGGLEGVVEQSAKLQVLGGDFAMGADPMAMAYESFMDPEGFAKRMNSMIANEGTFNSKTGEVDFGIASQMKMRAMAEATGQDYKDVLAQAKQAGKIKQIQNSLNGDFTEDQQSLIANKAKYDAENKTWYVIDNNKQRVDVEKINQSNIGDIGPEMSEEELGKTQLEAMQNMVSELVGMRSTQETMQGTEQEMKAKLEQEMWPTLVQANSDMMRTIKDNFDNNINTYKTQVSNAVSTMTSSVTTFKQMFQNGNTSIDTEVSRIGNIAHNIDETLCDIAKEMGLQAQAADVKVDTSKASNIEKSGVKEDWENFKIDGGTRITSAMHSILEDKYGDDATDHLTYSKLFRDGYYIHHRDGVLKDVNEFLDKNPDIKKQLYNLNMDNDLNDGFISQNGSIAKIDSKDQVLAAKNGGPIDKLLTTVNDSMAMIYESFMNPEGFAKRMNSMIANEGTFNSKTGEVDFGIASQMKMRAMAAVTGQSYKDLLNSARKSAIERQFGGSEPRSNVFEQLEQRAQSNISPRPMPYNSQVLENPYRNNNANSGNGGKMEIAPIQIQINGNIQLNGGNSSTDLTRQLANDPNFIRSLSQIISMEVEKKVQGGRVVDPVNRGLSY